MISTLVLDIETTDLAADRGVVLCVCYESSKEPGAVRTLRNDKISKSWKKGIRGDDKEIVRQTCGLITEHDVIVAHNGMRFDLPFLRTRALHWGLPALIEPKVVDPLKILWNKHRLRHNSLGVIADHLGLKDRKTPLEMSVWADAMLNGSKAAMDVIVEHCEADVRVLTGVLSRMTPFIKVLDQKGSGL